MPKFLNFLWPIERRTDSNVAVRLGRVFHWVGLALALPWPFLAVVIFSESLKSASSWPDFSPLALALVGLVPALGGRALRYILGNE